MSNDYIDETIGISMSKIRKKKHLDHIKKYLEIKSKQISKLSKWYWK